MSETNVFAQFCFLVMMRNHYRKPMCLHSFVWLCFKNMSETLFLHSLIFWLWLERIIGNQCVCTVLFGYVLKRCRKPMFGRPCVFWLWLESIIGNKCFWTVFDGGVKNMSETSMFSNSFVLWLCLKKHYRKPMFWHRFVWLCLKTCRKHLVKNQF